MSKLSEQVYIDQHYQLKQIWTVGPNVFSVLETFEQRVVHDYYQPSKDLSDERLLIHYHTYMSDQPDKAAEAEGYYLTLTSAYEKAKERAARPRVVLTGQRKRPPRGAVRVRAVIRPEPDFHLLAKALIALARDDLAKERAAKESRAESKAA